jgi:hypothetical protein
MSDNKRIKLVLKFFNRVLDELDMDEIDDLRDFKNIDRKLLIKPEIREIIEDMHSDIKDNICDAKVVYYKRNNVKEFNLVYMRALCKGIGMRFTAKRVNKMKNYLMSVSYLYYIC